MSTARAAAVQLPVEISRQPDGVSCGPTCLHALYRFYGEDPTLTEIIDGVRPVISGGTLLSHLACHALARGYRCTISTWNYQVLDPSWFAKGVDIEAKLREQMRWKSDQHALVEASRGYIDFLRAGGKLVDTDLTGGYLRRHLKRGVPVIVGLSATYLYRTVRQYGPDGIDDDIRGKPEGHFVIIDGYGPKKREFSVSDPYAPADAGGSAATRGGRRPPAYLVAGEPAVHPGGQAPLQPPARRKSAHEHPMAEGQRYRVSEARLLAAVMQGIATYDANVLLVERKGKA